MKRRGTQMSKGEMMRRLDRARAAAKLKSGAGYLLLKLAGKVNEYGEAWCTEEDLAGNAMHRVTASVHLRKLEAEGIVWRIAWKPGLRALATPARRPSETPPDPCVAVERWEIPDGHHLWFLSVGARKSSLEAWRRYPGKVHGRPRSERIRGPNVDAFVTTAANDAPSLAPAATSTPPPAVTLAPTVAAETSTPAVTRRTDAPQLCEVFGFLSAVAEARKLRPDLPREAWVKAGKVRRNHFDPDRQRVDVRVVTAWAEHIMRGGW